jgi:hypothetical protein
MNLLNAAPQDVFSSGAYNVGSTIPPGVDVIRINQDLEKAPSLNLHLSVPSKNTHLLNASRSCSPTRMRLNKRPRTRPDIIDKKLVCPKRNRNDTKLRNDRRLKERALAILETEFRFNPRPDQQTMQVQARLIGSTFDDISQWFDQMRRQGLQSNLNQDRRGLRPKEPSSRDRISPVRRTRKNSEDHSGLIQIFDSTKSRKERNAAWDTQKKKWQCTTPSCMKPLKNKSEWVRHENTHGQPSEYVCMSRGCSRAVLSSAVPCPSCASTSQRRRRPIASCQCQTSERCRFKRKDKLQEHLRKQHNLMLPPSVVSEWTEQINHDSRSRCGFCGENLENWEMRLSHIAEHFESGWEMSSWNETLTGELSDEEKEEEENGDKDMSDFDEMEEDSDNENGDASLDDSPDAGADNENQDENSGDRGSGDAKDTGSDGYWQYFSPSTRNSSPLTTANPNSYYALVAIIYSGNFRHEVYALERRQFSATLHAVSNSQLSQFYVATFHTNQDRIATSLPESPQQDILALVSQVTVPKGASSSLWLLQPTFGSPRQQLFAGTHLAQILTSGPNLLHETVYAPQGSLKSRTTMGYLLPDHHTLRGFQRLLRSSWPQKLDSLPLSMFTGLRRNDRGLLCHTPDGSGQGFRRTHPNVSYSTVDHESVRFTVNGNSGINPMANASINLSPPNLHNFADSRSALSDVSHVPVPNEFSASFVSNEDISGESSPCLDCSSLFWTYDMSNMLIEVVSPYPFRME